MAGEAVLPQGLTEDQRQWIHWRMDWLCENFGEALLENAKVAIPNGSQFAQIFSTQSIDRSESAELALDYLKRLCHWLDCDSSQYHLDVSNDPQRWKSPNEIAIDTAALSNRPNLLALLAHELSFAQLLEHTELSEDAEDIEGLADLMGVFFGLGIVLAAAAPGDEMPEDAYFEVCLSPVMLAYALALFAEMRGETKPAWAGELGGEMLEGFYDSQYYLEQLEEEPASAFEKHEEPDQPESEDGRGLEVQTRLAEKAPTKHEDDEDEIACDQAGYDSEPNTKETVESWRDEQEEADLAESESASSSADEDELPERRSEEETRQSGIGKEKCPDCGRLKSPETPLCEMCQDHYVDPRAALREELAKHGDTDHLWLQFGLILALTALALTAFSYL